jgi:hypothetical protein
MHNLFSKERKKACMINPCFSLSSLFSAGQIGRKVYTKSSDSKFDKIFRKIIIYDIIWCGIGTLPSGLDQA